MRRIATIGGVLVLLLAACSGDQGSNQTTTTTSAASDQTTMTTESTMATETTAADTSDGATPDNCSLITADEATALAGHTLQVGQDSMLGCGFIPPDGSVADMAVLAVMADGDAASFAATYYPDAAETIPVSVGSDTVAVTTPEDDAVAAIITGDNGHFIELQVVFLGIDPRDTAGIEAAAQLATTALSRWK
jgi:hypothetical protein